MVPIMVLCIVMGTPGFINKVKGLIAVLLCSFLKVKTFK
ncbi:MAG: hypothetical protein RL577_552 [Bacteroidota bacterium]